MFDIPNLRQIKEILKDKQGSAGFVCRNTGLGGATRLIKSKFWCYRQPWSRCPTQSMHKSIHPNSYRAIIPPQQTHSLSNK